MKRFLCLFATAVIFNACSSTKNTPMVASTNANVLTPGERNDGWQLLFDGKTTNGWHSYGKQTIGNAWKVGDGTLYLDTSVKKDGKRDGGDIVTADEFENFHLKLDWKISVKGNSGIMFNVKEDIAKYQHPYYTGPEMQVLDNDGHPDAKIIKHRAGDLYDLISVSRETVKPVGEWNTAEIMLNNGNLSFHLNGERVVNTTMWNEAWRAMVAASKFKSWPDFATYKKGKIALQDHGDNVWFRNIKIRRL